MRAFVALMLGDELGERVADAVEVALGGQERARRRYRLPRARGLHLTLAFLGEVEAEVVDERLVPELERRAAGAAAPTLELAEAGAFPRRGRERVLWIGVREAGEALDDLRARVLGAVGAAGLAAERAGEAFRPHVTVARPRGGGRVPDDFYALDLALPWRPVELALVESVDAEGPRRYVPRARVPLAVER